MEKKRVAWSSGKIRHLALAEFQQKHEASIEILIAAIT